MIVRALACACAVMGLLAPAAGARVVTVDASLGADRVFEFDFGDPGPRLAGGSVVWADHPPDGSIHVMRADLASGARTELSTTPRPAKAAEFLAADVAGSSSAMAAAVRRIDPAGTKNPQYNTLEGHLMGARLGGAAATLVSCRSYRGLGALSLALTDEVLVTAQETCADPAIGSTLLIRPVTAAGFGAPAPFDTGMIFTRNVSAAGPYIAWNGQTPTGGLPIVVWNRVVGAEAYRVASTGIGRWAIQADGTFVGLRFVPAAGCELVWASIAEPVLHSSPSASCLMWSRLRLAAGRIVYRQDTTLVSRTLDGPETVVARGVSPTSGFDFDGTRIAYGVPGCASDTIVVRDLTDGEPPAAPPRDCRAILASRTVRIPVGRLARLELTCPDGCRGTVRVFGQRAKKSGGILTVPLLVLPIRAAPGQRVTVAGRVAHAAVAKLGCRAAYEGNVQLEIRKASGLSTSDGLKRVRLVLDRQQGCPKR